MKFKINDLGCLLSDAFSSMCAFDHLDFDTEEYKASRANALKSIPQEHLCREDVWAQMLLDGHALTLRESETGEEHKLTYEPLAKAIRETLEENEYSSLCDFLEKADFYDTEAIIQRAVFGEVVYG